MNRTTIRSLTLRHLINALVGAVVLLAPVVASATPDVILYDGEAGSAPLLAGKCPEFASQAGGQGVGGGAALALAPDAWHEPALNLYCGGGARRDLSSFDALEFMMRSTKAGGNPTFKVRTWDNVGQTVQINDYIEGGVLDGTWRLVRIPIADLKSADWGLGNVERLVWGKDTSNPTWYVDNVAVRDLYGPELTDAIAASEHVVRVVVNERFDLDSARDTSHYTLSSPGDAAYAGGVKPVDAGVHIRFDDFGSGGEAIDTYTIYLRFKAALKSGKTYSLAASGVSDQAGNAAAPVVLTFTYDDVTQVNPAIKVNQVGYLPDRPKVGYVGDYYGDLGGAVWAVGDGGTIYRWDDVGGWKPSQSPVSTSLRGVAATTETLALAVGDGGTVLRWDGDSWKVVSAVTTSDLYDVTFGPTRIGWLVGAGGTAIRYEGGTFTKTPTPTTATLRGVYAGEGDVAYAVGDGGVILRWSGGSWGEQKSPTTSDLNAVAGITAGQLFAVGAAGTVLALEYGNWKVWTARPSTNATLRGVATDPSGGVWVSGDGGLVWFKEGFGKDNFNAQASKSSASLRSIARVDERCIWAVGGNGSTVLRGEDGFVAGSLPAPDLNDVYSLAYGAMRMSEPAPLVTIVEADTGVAVASAKLELRAANWALSGEDVYLFDFSDLTTEGDYRAYVPGVGVSDAFHVGKDTYDIVAYTTARSFFYQRCGEALEAPYAAPEYQRETCHSPEFDAAYHDSLPGTPLYAGEQVGKKIDASGGWHDAGDFGKYMPTAVVAVWYLLEGYELDTSKFPDGSWNIPESGNGIPDVLDEVRVAVDWMVKIQRADGGIPHKVTAQCWFDGMPQDEHVMRYVFETTTHDTATGAAIMASAARAFAPFDAALSKKYLDAAKLSWDFLQKHTSELPAGGFKNPSGNCTGAYTETGDNDNRMWAAAELYRTTGDAKYRTAFEGWWGQYGKEWGWHDWQHHYAKAYWAYLRAPQADGNPAIKNSIRDTFISRADDIVGFTLHNAYMSGSRLDVPEWIGWGTFTMGPKSAFPLLQAFALTGNEAYRDLAVINADAQLGVNPLSMSFITGLGARYPMNPLDMESEHDGVEKPVPGLPVFGPHNNQSKGNPFQVATQDDTNNYPVTWTTDDPLPILRRFNDAFELPMMTEFTVLEMGLTTVVFHLLAEQASPEPPPIAACGGPGACDDGNPCTKDECDPAVGCVSTWNSAPCTDGDPCTINDICHNGACTGEPIPCDDPPPGGGEEPPPGGGEEPPPPVVEPPGVDIPWAEPHDRGTVDSPAGGVILVGTDEPGGALAPPGASGGLGAPSVAPGAGATTQPDPGPATDLPTWVPTSKPQEDSADVPGGGDVFITYKGCSTSNGTVPPAPALALALLGLLWVRRRRASR